MAKKYRVLNPRGLPKGTILVSYHHGGKDWNWKEGDLFVLPAGMDADGRLVHEGQIEEVTDG